MQLASENNNLPTNFVLEYSDPQFDILETTADRVLFHSGVGSGKSQCIGVISYEFVLNNPEMIGFIGANTVAQLSNSTLKRVFDTWQNQFKLKEGVHYTVGIIPPKTFKKFGADMLDYSRCICFWNGAMIFINSLDNYKVIDGVELGWALLDETKDTKEEAVKEVIIQRLRQKGMYICDKNIIWSESVCKRKVAEEKWQIIVDAKGTFYVNENGYKLQGYNPLYIFTSPSKTKWLSDWFNLDDDAEEIVKQIFSETDYYRKRKGRRLVIISSTYHNRQNLPPGYIEGMIDDLSGDESLIDMQIYGSPFGKSGGEFVTTYSRLKHVKDFEPWDDSPVHITFDFNVVPYITATLWQIKHFEEMPTSKKPGYLVRCFDEFCLPNPKNDSESLCEEIITHYEKLLVNGVYYYGDYSGATDTTVSKNIKNNYQAIENKLKRFLSNSSRRVIVNQGLEKRRRFLNRLFKGTVPGVEIEIGIKAKELRGDLEFCQQGPDGGKLKQIVKKDGRSYQERGHALDSLEYFVTSAFNRLFSM